MILDYYIQEERRIRELFEKYGLKYSYSSTEVKVLRKLKLIPQNQ